MYVYIYVHVLIHICIHVYVYILAHKKGKRKLEKMKGAYQSHM